MLQAGCKRLGLQTVPVGGEVGTFRQLSGGCQGVGDCKVNLRAIDLLNIHIGYWLALEFFWGIVG